MIIAWLFAVWREYLLAFELRLIVHLRVGHERLGAVGASPAHIISVADSPFFERFAFRQG